MNLPREAYVVVTERDTDTGNDPRGPLLWEQYLDRPYSQAEAIKVGERLRHRYGEILVCKLVPVAGSGYQPTGPLARIKHILSTWTKRRQQS